jgi:hypothetical protein
MLIHLPEGGPGVSGAEPLTGFGAVIKLVRIWLFIDGH